MLVRLLASGFALALLAASTPADDKKDPKDAPAFTTWTRSANDIDLKFEMSKETMKFTALTGENGVTVTCKVTVDKEGVVKATVTDAVEKGNFPAVPKKGFEFSFKWKEKGDTADLSDLKGEGLDEVKAVVEGEYKKKK